MGFPSVKPARLPEHRDPLLGTRCPESGGMPIFILDLDLPKR